MAFHVAMVSGQRDLETSVDEHVDQLRQSPTTCPNVGSCVQPVSTSYGSMSIWSMVPTTIARTRHFVPACSRDSFEVDVVLHPPPLAKVGHICLLEPPRPPRTESQRLFLARGRDAWSEEEWRVGGENRLARDRGKGWHPREQRAFVG